MWWRTANEDVPIDQNSRKRLVSSGALLPVVFVAFGLSLSPNVPSWSLSAPISRNSSNTIGLSCSDSAGQQARGNEDVVGGVEGLLLPGSEDPAAMTPIGTSGGKRYFVYKAFLAVSPSVSRYATVSVRRPKTARVWYGRSGSVQGRALIVASRPAVRLPVCGSKFTGYVGGIIITGPTRVTFAVSSPRRRTEIVTVAIGTG
jgi:hypothetical protein